jgi:hypothetical protein
MDNKKLKVPEREKLIKHVIDSLNIYWIKNSELLNNLPIKNHSNFKIQIPLKLVAIKLPDWAARVGVKDCLLVPVECSSENKNWNNIDWWLASFLLLECWHERVWESSNGPIHSYSLKLKNWDNRAWDYAYVNRIGIFLRLWLSRTIVKPSDEVFGKIKSPQFLITHDVDAINKTTSIRIKQGIFNLLNTLRLLYKFKFKGAMEKLYRALRLIFSNEDWNTFEKLFFIEEKYKVQSIFNFYADLRKNNFKKWFFDPSYDIKSSKVINLISYIKKNGGAIGLHPSYDSWESKNKIFEQRNNLMKACQEDISYVRQHWLRFSWEKTLKVQCESGLKIDSTIMFNDRPGFRSSAALKWKPWNNIANHKHSIYEIPTVLMDSHFYDYSLYENNIQRKNNIQNWIKEIKEVSGHASVLWHSHTLSDDYGWQDGFEYLLESIKEK